MSSQRFLKPSSISKLSRRTFSTPAKPPPKTPEEIKANLERAQKYKKFNTVSCKKIDKFNHAKY